jgi:hypothetical protein
MSPEARARKKVKQLEEEMKKPKLDWRSIAHLACDLSAVAQPQKTKQLCP